MKTKIIYKESYKKGACVIKQELKPVLRHQAEGFDCVLAEITSGGVCELDGVCHEFQDIRVYLKERA